MSRHRNVRSMNYEDEYYDDEDDYSRSFEDNYCISPGTVAQFTWNRERNMNLASYMGADQVIDEVEVEEDKDQEGSYLQDSFNASQAQSNISDVDQARLNSCLEEIHNIIGETVPESVIVDAIVRNQFSVEKSLDELLSQQDAPKPQRQPRNRNRSQDDSDDTNELNKLLADIQSLESITKPDYHAPTLLRFKSNPGSDDINSHIEIQQFSESSPRKISSEENNSSPISGFALVDKSHSTHKPSASVASSGSLFSLLHRESKETSLSKPSISLEDLAKRTKPTLDSKETGAKINLKDHSKLIDVKAESGKVSLADLAKLSNDKKGVQNKSSKESNLDSVVSNLSGAFSENLSVASSFDTSKSDSGKVSLADLAKRHSSSRAGVVAKNKVKVGDSSSDFSMGCMTDDKEKRNTNREKSLNPLAFSTKLDVGSGRGVMKTLSSHSSLSELANQHKTNLQSLHGGLKKDSKLSGMSALTESNKLAGSHSQSSVVAKSSAKRSSTLSSAEHSLSKLSLTCCLRTSKQTVKSCTDGKSDKSLECFNDLSHVFSPHNLKENARFVPLSVFESVDMTLVSSPSTAAVVFSNLAAYHKKYLPGDRGVKRKVNFPSFTCHNQVKKRRIMYPQQELHQISPFNFSTLSPDDVVKKKQKQAFSRSEKEFNVDHSSHS